MEGFVNSSVSCSMKLSQTTHIFLHNLAISVSPLAMIPTDTYLYIKVQLFSKLYVQTYEKFIFKWNNMWGDWHEPNIAFAYMCVMLKHRVEWPTRKNLADDVLRNAIKKLRNTSPQNLITGVSWKHWQGFTHIYYLKPWKRL